MQKVEAGKASRQRTIQWLWVYQAAVYGLGMVLVAGLIPAWGRWYSPSPHHRAQVEALLQGRLALSEQPTALGHDLAWAEGGVHQVWGLGAPLWRLPFEALTRLLGAEGFPDLLAFAAALGIAAWLVLRALHEVSVAGNASATSEPAAQAGSLAHAPQGWRMAGGALLLLLFPPFINLIHTRFDIYEEVVAYEYVWGLVMIAGLLQLAANATKGRFWAVCALAGLGGLIRPTLVFHGTGVLLAAVVAWAWGRGSGADAGRRLSRRFWLVMIIGAGLFVIGGSVLFVTNWVRFGSGFEFGHQLNVQFLYGSMYATRFDYPFQHESLGSAARELFSLLFLASDFNGGDFYRAAIFPGQSPTVRWRELYISAYDGSFLVLLLGGWGTAAWWGRRWWRRCLLADDGGAANVPEPGRASIVLGLYSLVSSALLLGLFLRNSVIASRYLLDLMPAFAAALLAGWLGWGVHWQKRRGGTWVLALSVVALSGWTGWEILNGRSAYGPPRTLTWEEVLARKASVPAQVHLPTSGGYSAASEPGKTGIPYNGAGWKSPSGAIMPCVILFVDDPEFLELELTPQAGQVEPAVPDDLRAKIGLEFLDRQSFQRGTNGWTVRFAGPKRPQYQHGIQPVFLATVPNIKLAEHATPWRLTRIRWRSGEPNSGG